MQRAQLRRWLAEGRRLVGRKIGLTTRRCSASWGWTSPDFGVLIADMAVPDGEQVPLAELLQPRVEAEVAFVLGADLDLPHPTAVDLIRAVDHRAAGDRDRRLAGSPDWDISIVDTVADNASSGKFVLGTRPVRLSEVDLRDVRHGAGARRSARVGRGGRRLPREPAARPGVAGAAPWPQAGNPLRAGDVVLSGALGPMVPVTPHAAYEARISGLGSVRVRFDGGADDRAAA